MLVDHNQLQNLTGLQQTAAMRKQLKRQGIPFRVTRGGRLWTTWDAINSTLVGHAKKKTGPNLDALTAKS
jgi:hypothetical protein